MHAAHCLVVLFIPAIVATLPDQAQSSFVNYETAHVSPIALSPDGATLAVCNTPDNRVEIFDVSSGVPRPVGAIPVGLDPCSVRFRSDSELWCVNQISDSVSVIDLAAGQVIDTLQTEDEPADVIFAGNPLRAYVSCSQTNAVLVYDPAARGEALARIPVDDDAPRTLQVSPDGNTVYVAIFESGNSSTVEGSAQDLSLWPWASNGGDSVELPYGGQNPTPQLPIPAAEGTIFPLPENEELPPAPRTSLVMTFGLPLDFHDWQDGQQVPFKEVISGARAELTGRIPGWTRADYGIAIIDTADRGVTYTQNYGNMNLAMATNPASGVVAVAGFRAHNYTRFEPNAQGSFTQLNLFLYNPVNGQAINTNRNKINAHVTRNAHSIPVADRERSVGDTRGMAWRGDGKLLYITGMGSNNIVTFNEDGKRAGVQGSPFTIEVGEGPTGVVTDAARDQLYVLNRFGSSISVVSTETNTEVQRVPFHDPTPEIICKGRRFFYDTHATSGTGMVSCATCHVDGKTDKFAWNLGEPGGEMLSVHGEANAGGNVAGLADDLEDWHPAKGDMFTQTLQDIIGHEPLHWRGDRRGIEEFNPSFVALLGRDEQLTDEEMAEFKGFLATIAFPPNPNRNLDNSLPTDLDLPADLLTAGTFGPAREPLPNGNAQQGLNLFRNALPRTGRQIRCVECHTLPTGMGTNYQLTESGVWELIPPGPNDEAHHALVSITGSSQKTFKVPHLRSVREKLGFDLQAPVSRQGFGFMHDGSLDTLPRLLSDGHFSVARSDQDVADLSAFLLSFTGSDFPEDSSSNDPPGTSSQDSHAAVGFQQTIFGDIGKGATAVDELLTLLESDRIRLTARWQERGLIRGAVYQHDAFQTDRADEVRDASDLLALAEESPVTLTVVQSGTETRIALDRDEDGLYDYDELRTLSPANPFDPENADTTGDDGAVDADGLDDGDNDYDGDGLSNAEELADSLNPVSNDSDSDGLEDGTERAENTDPRDADTDNDGLEDGAEVSTHDTNPLVADTDGDGLLDAAEVNLHLTDPTNNDSDGDGLGDSPEINTHETNPNFSDTDEDGLNDGAEVNNHDTNPLVADTDGDALDDGAEVNQHQSNPNNEDSDGDTLGDGVEVSTHGTNPNNSDSDSDTLPDDWEIENGLNALSAAGDDGGNGDPDEDGISNSAERAGGTDPNVSDTPPDEGGCSGEKTGKASGDALVLQAVAFMLFLLRKRSVKSAT